MFIDARKMDEGLFLQTTVCIIGAGMAGITIAMELKKNGITTVLLESGGLSPDKLTSDLSNGENAGLPYTFADGSRSRYLGGSSNCWGGWCAPMSNFDFEKRDWVNHSGWPIDINELEPYYKLSHSVLKLGPYNYDPSYWENAIGRTDVRRIPLTSGKVKDGISQFSPPVRLGILYQDELKETKQITTLLYANVTGIETDETGSTVTSVKVATLSGNTLFVSAKLFVLATGGIENARLLLSSNKVQQNGLGNAHDLVGRFFMDHPRVLSGNIRFASQWKNNRLYDVRYHFHDTLVSANNVCVASQFVLSPEVMKKEKLLNSLVSFYSVFRSERSKGVIAAMRLRDAIVKKRVEGFHLRKDLASVIAHPIDITMYGFASKFRFRSMVRDVKFQVIMEQEPDPGSRVMLAKEKDHLGMNRIRVNWRLGEMERRTFNRVLKIMSEEFKSAGVAETVSLIPDLEKDNWPEGLTGTWHHIGTTRMNDSPKQGVVDRNCRVHSTNNLYVAGSSVFPTSGANFPTITLTALAIRLSDHIKKELKK